MQDHIALFQEQYLHFPSELVEIRRMFSREIEEQYWHLVDTDNYATANIARVQNYIFYQIFEFWAKFHFLANMTILGYYF